MSPRRSARLSAASSATSVRTKRPSLTSHNLSLSTPRTKREKTLTVPKTPTLAAIGTGMVDTSWDNDNRLLVEPLTNRLAAPDASNAPLRHPEIHRLFATESRNQKIPSKESAVEATTTTTTSTTTNILDEAITHLIKVEPKLQPIIEKNPCRLFSPEGLAEEIDPFKALSSSIISQQVSGAAAKSILNKFVALFNSDDPDASSHLFPTPSQVCATSLETLRTAGLSQRKAEYIHGLADKFHREEITAEMLLTVPYEDLLNTLIQVRGLGKWSVEMFACFALKRMDVFSTGDLGVQRGMATLMGKDVNKLKGKGGKWKYMSEQEMVKISDQFRPYRSLFMWLTWRISDTDVSTQETQQAVSSF